MHRCLPVNFAKFLRIPFLQNTFERLPLSTSSWKYQHDSRNHIHIAEHHYKKTLIFEYIYSCLIKCYFQRGFNSSKFSPAVKTFYCISIFRLFVTKHCERNFHQVRIIFTTYLKWSFFRKSSTSHLCQGSDKPLRVKEKVVL